MPLRGGCLLLCLCAASALCAQQQSGSGVGTGESRAPVLDRERRPADELAPMRELIVHGQAANALPNLESYVAAHPDSVAARYLLAYGLYVAKEPKRSLEAYTEAAKLRRPGAGDLMAVAADYVMLADYADAARWLTEVTVMEPSNATAWYYLGRSRFLLQQYDDARKAYAETLRLSPQHVRAEVGLGLIEEAQGRAHEAMQSYQLAQQWQEHAPEQDAQPLLSAGELALKQGELQEALKALKGAEKRSHGNPRVYEDLGRVYQRLDRYADAEAALQKAETLSPDVPSLHFLRGTALQHLHRTAEAQQEFEKAKGMFGTVSGRDVPNFDEGGSKP